MIPRITLDECEFNKERKLLIAVSPTSGFPKEIEVYSHFTDRVILFTKDEAAALRNEFWDGELYEYRPTTQVKNVECLSLRVPVSPLHRRW